MQELDEPCDTVHVYNVYSLSARELPKLAFHHECPQAPYTSTKPWKHFAPATATPRPPKSENLTSSADHSEAGHVREKHCPTLGPPRTLMLSSEPKSSPAILCMWGQACFVEQAGISITVHSKIAVKHPWSRSRKQCSRRALPMSSGFGGLPRLTTFGSAAGCRQIVVVGVSGPPIQEPSLI